ncbi:hypothetical protein OG625_26355 [Streptomyces sp. NBC_01351]|uniref:hypothetical protein n=1 Tax=Streptomyces sp. NBC_01351 TaxID=2903833 RepID=UPI002E371AC5|nr:hypothetical protein [Streptomyces sp. NBC_01351]
MRHPLHVPLSVPVAAVPKARHRRPSRPSVLASVRPAQRLAVGLGLASVLAASVLTAAVDPAAPVAPDRVADRQSSTFAQVFGD